MKVYLDMDGVIADFFSAAVKLADCEHSHWRDMEQRDIQRALNKVRKTPGFFSSVPAFPMANTLVRSIVNIAGGYTILSSPLESYPGCADEKIGWIEKNIHIQPDEIIISSNKPKYASDNILIDDYGYNCRKWEEAGGFAIKYQADEQHVSDAIISLQALYKNQL